MREIRTSGSTEGGSPSGACFAERSQLAELRRPHVKSVAWSHSGLRDARSEGETHFLLQCTRSARSTSIRRSVTSLAGTSNRRLVGAMVSGYISGSKTEVPSIMPIGQRKKALSQYRRRLTRRGVIRLEVHVRKDDAPLVRGIVRALADPNRESETRALLRERFGTGKASGLKALLASAPLEGVDLSRPCDFGRDIEL
jgi:hypothetical protein